MPRHAYWPEVGKDEVVCTRRLPVVGEEIVVNTGLFVSDWARGARAEVVAITGDYIRCRMQVRKHGAPAFALTSDGVRYDLNLWVNAAWRDVFGVVRKRPEPISQ